MKNVLLVLFVSVLMFSFAPQATQTMQADKAQAKKMVYYCTSGDKVYHKSETCSELKACTSKKNNTVKWAKKNGYKACAVCKK